MTICSSKYGMHEHSRWFGSKILCICLFCCLFLLLLSCGREGWGLGGWHSAGGGRGRDRGRGGKARRLARDLSRCMHQLKYGLIRAL